MNEKRFTCVLGNDYHIINNNVDDMTYFLQDGNDVVLVINLLNKLYEENEQLRLELETHKHPLWSTREAEKKVNKLADSLADEVKKNGLLNEEINQLRIENMRLKKKRGDEMSEKRFTLEQWTKHSLYYSDGEYSAHMSIGFICEKVEKKLNEQQELIEELQVSDEMGWKRAEHFEKKCPKELYNKKMYIKRLEYKVQKFKEENEQLHQKNTKLISKIDFLERVIDGDV